jgi:undecaprenyl-diphosphatase
VKHWRLLLCIAISGVCLLGFIELAEDFAYSPAIVGVDQRVQAAALSWRYPLLTTVMRVFTLAGGTVFVTSMTAALAAWLWARSRRQGAIFAFVGVAGGVLLSTVAKGAFGRQRPPAASALVDLPSSYSFPSGHSMASFCLAVVIGTLAVRSDARPVIKAAMVAACVLYAALVGLSRVYLGVHYPSDVVASWLLGGFWMALVIGVLLDTQERGHRE